MLLLSMLQEYFLHSSLPTPATDLRNGKRALQCSLMAHVKVENDAVEAELIIDKSTR